MNKRLLITLAKYALALGLMGYVVWSNWKPDSPNGLAALWHKHVALGEPVHWGFFVLAFTAGWIGLSVTFLRWYFLVRAVDLPFRVIDAFRLGLMACFFNAFLPGSVGGDILKAAFLAKEHSRRTVAVATVIMDRAIALWALCWFVALLGAAFWLAGMLDGPGIQTCEVIILSAWAIVGSSLLAWILLGFLPHERAERFAGRLERIPRVGHAAAEFWRAVWIYRCRPRSVFGVLALSWVGHVFFVLLFYFSVRTLCEPGDDLPTLIQHFLIVPIGLVIQAIPLFPGGAGIGEFGFGALYSWLGKPPAKGVVGSLVQRVIVWIMGIVGYLVYHRIKGTIPADDIRVVEEEMEGTGEHLTESPVLETQGESRIAPG